MDFFSQFDELVEPTPPEPSRIEPLSFGGLLSPPLRLQTDQGQCGGQLWPAGMALGEFLLSNKLNFLRGKKILAIAQGLVQHAQHQSQCHTEIIITDGLPVLVPLMQQNIALNTALPEQSMDSPIHQSALTVKAAHLAWGEPLPQDLTGSVDVLLAADCAYLEDAFPLLHQTLQQLLGPSTVLWFCYKKRRKRDKDCLKLIAKTFAVRLISGRWEQDGVWLYEVTMNPKRAIVRHASETCHHSPSPS